MIDLEVRSGEIAAAILRHRLDDESFLHTNLKHTDCSCFVPPGMDGPTCIHCGGMTRRAGTCAVCVDCGETTGCG